MIMTFHLATAKNKQINFKNLKNKIKPPTFTPFDTHQLEVLGLMSSIMAWTTSKVVAWPPRSGVWTYRWRETNDVNFLHAFSDNNLALLIKTLFFKFDNFGSFFLHIMFHFDMFLWLKYCRYSIKHYLINQLIKVSNSVDTLPCLQTWPSWQNL